MNYTIADFPFSSDNQFNAMKRCDDVKSTMIAIVQQFLKVKRKSRLGKNIGSSLPEMLYELYDSDNLNEQAKLIRSELIEQFPEFNFHSLTMKIQILEQVSTLVVVIAMSTQFTEVYEFELYYPKI